MCLTHNKNNLGSYLCTRICTRLFRSQLGLLEFVGATYQWCSYCFVKAQDEINELGYDLLNLNNVKAAIEVFKINVELHRDSSNAYDSLAEAYYLVGNHKKALENYQQSLDLNPKNRNAQNMINIIHETQN